MNSYNSPVAALLRRPRTLKGPARLVAVLIAVALVGSGTACGGEPVEYFTPPPSTPTPEVAASDEPEVFERPDVRLIHPPKKPNVMLDLSEESALAFAHYFVDVLNYTANSGDTTILEEISGPECGYCHAAIEEAQSLEKLGAWSQDYKLEYTAEPELTVREQFVFAYDVTLYEESYSTYTPEGELEPLEGREYVGALIVYRLGEYWVVGSFGSKAEEQ